ncbi:Uncharacterised protein [Mycobacteroides abscessus subsp. abscessus]|nr:Uncharacterised protein [Mycobacteroides abscessus subsp. abscessus]
MALSDLYTEKQINIYKRTRQEDWFMLLNHGAVRAGKTQLDNDLFLNELIRVKELAACVIWNYSIQHSARVNKQIRHRIQV